MALFAIPCDNVVVEYNRHKQLAFSGFRLNVNLLGTQRRLCTVPLFEQYVLAELLKSCDYERHVNRVRRRRREALRQQ